MFTELFKKVRNVFKSELQIIEEEAYNKRAKELVVELGKKRAEKEYGKKN